MTLPAAGPPRGTAVEIVTIGDELLLGFTVDTNAAALARALSGIGMHVVRRTTVGDDAGQIGSAVRDALDRTGAVITTGGLGPTADDLTKPSVAELFGRPMRLDEALLARLEARWRKRFDRPMPAPNRQQALVPDGAATLENNHGSAPGIWLEDERGRWVAMLPGVPREMRGMLADTLLPRLEARAAGTVVRSLTLRTTGVAESLLAERIEAAIDQPLEPSLAYLPSVTGVDLRLTVRGLVAGQAEELLTAAAVRLHACLGECIYGHDGDDLAAIVLEACRARGLTLAVAESCTGGLLGARLTAVPGSSDVVRGGVIAYHNDVKLHLLGVGAEVLRDHGAVSEPVARAMASGARRAAGSDVGVSITGIAGPAGGTPEKPVGTVWIGLDVGGTVATRLLHLIGDRQEIRERSAQWALELIRQALSADESRRAL